MDISNLEYLHTTIQYKEELLGVKLDHGNYVINKSTYIQLIKKDGSIELFRSPLYSFSLIYGNLEFVFCDNNVKSYDVDNEDLDYYHRLCRKMLHHMVFSQIKQITYIIDFKRKSLHYVEKENCVNPILIPDCLVLLPFYRVENVVKIHNNKSFYLWGYDNNELNIYLQSKNKMLYLLFNSGYHNFLTINGDNIIEKGIEIEIGGVTYIKWTPVGGNGKILYDGEFILRLILQVLKFSKRKNIFISSEGKVSLG